MKLKKVLLSVLVAGALSATGASATIITLNPSAPNTGCTISAGLPAAGQPCGPVGTNGAFGTDNAHTGFTSVIDISSNTGAATVAESGNFRILDFDVGGTQLSSTVTGVNRGQAGNYDIYAGFMATGAGQWLTPFNFVGTSITSLNVTLYASPAGGSAEQLGTPTSGTDANAGITFGSHDFILGTATLIADPTNFATANLNLFNHATTSLLALLQFTPAGGPTGPLTGATGFFQAPMPFQINIGTQNGANAENTNWLPTATGGYRIVTANTLGGGSVAFVGRVPEPAPLALVGMGLAVMGFVSYRSKARS